MDLLSVKDGGPIRKDHTQMPPRRPTIPPALSPVLSSAQLRRRIEGLRKCIEELQEFDPQQVQKRYGIPEVEGIEASVKNALIAAFGHGTPRYNLFKDAADLDRGPHTVRLAPAFGRGPSIDYDAQDAIDARKYLADGKDRSIQLIQRAIRSLEDNLTEQEQPTEEFRKPAAFVATPQFSRKVFVVHGHDEGARDATEGFLRHLDFEPIILHKQASGNRTVIEKIEAHRDVGFVVVLLTPDDIGCAKSGVPVPRARQNVLLELGYFVGYLGRDRVCALRRGEDLEIPSDFGGVIFETYDDHGAWKQKLARELANAGYDIDGKKLLNA